LLKEQRRWAAAAALTSSSSATFKKTRLKKIDMKANRKTLMKTRQPSNNVKESTYALLVRSEDKKHALLETILYGLIATGVLVAILQFADQPVSIGA